MATQGDIARHLGLDVSSVNKILHHKPGAKFRKATVDQVFRAARKLGFRVEALKHAHRRADPRLKVRIFCGITLYREGGEVFVCVGQRGVTRDRASYRWSLGL